jgi:hypothetical protein
MVSSRAPCKVPVSTLMVYEIDSMWSCQFVLEENRDSLPWQDPPSSFYCCLMPIIARTFCYARNGKPFTPALSSPLTPELQCKCLPSTGPCCHPVPVLQAHALPCQEARYIVGAGLCWQMLCSVGRVLSPGLRLLVELRHLAPCSLKL